MKKSCQFVLEPTFKEEYELLKVEIKAVYDGIVPFEDAWNTMLEFCQNPNIDLRCYDEVETEVEFLEEEKILCQVEDAVFYLKDKFFAHREGTTFLDIRLKDGQEKICAVTYAPETKEQRFERVLASVRRGAKVFHKRQEQNRDKDIYEVYVEQKTRKDYDKSLVGTFRVKEDAIRCFKHNVGWANEQMQEFDCGLDIETKDDFYSITALDESNTSIVVSLQGKDFDRDFDEVKHIPSFSLLD